MNKDLEKILKVLDDAKLDHIRVYDLQNQNPFYNYVFISTASNKRQLNAALGHIDEEKIPYEHIEGRGSEDWVLIDCGEILINVMSREAREMYALDDIYINAKRIDEYE